MSFQVSQIYRWGGSEAPWHLIVMDTDDMHVRYCVLSGPGDKMPSASFEIQRTKADHHLITGYWRLV